MQGKTINGYTLQRLLGAGGMAEVWLAENKIHKRAAVKILNIDLSHNAQIVERFRNEAEIMVKLNHPNIRQVYDYDDLDGRPCIIMEYLEGDDLKAMMKRGHRFTDAELQKYWDQLVDALNYTHAQGIVHRDIKPSNIFIDGYGNVKLMDFGIAKNNEGGSGTQTGSTLGTRIYMSPEQVKDPKRVDYRTDHYSLAVTFVHLLTGKAPYDSTTTSDFEIQLSIVTKPLDLSTVQESWQAFLGPYLEKEPGKRPELRPFEKVKVVSVPEPAPVVDQDDATVWESNYPRKAAPISEVTPTLVTSDETPVKKREEVMPKEEKFSNSEAVQEQESEELISLPITVNGVSFEMVKVIGGSYVMGASKGGFFKSADSVRNYDADANEDEKPVHNVTLDNFFIAKTQVTQALWRAVMEVGPDCNGEWEARYGLGDEYPAYRVSWSDIQDFLEKLNQLTDKQFRLPTEAEWEYAARGGKKGDGNKYSGGYDLSTVAWFTGNSDGHTHPVGQKAPNPLGLYDMSGNVWEWCNDWYGTYGRILQINPQGPFSGSSRVLRGGSWRDNANYCRVSSRSWFSPNGKYNGYGFRIVCDEQ